MEKERRSHYRPSCRHPQICHAIPRIRSYQFKFFASAKYEVLIELIKQLSKAYIPLYVFAAHVVPDSIFLKRNLIGRFLYRSWSSLSHVFTQDASSSERLGHNGIPATETGDSRADRVLQIAHSTSIPQFLQKWKGEDTVLVAGSRGVKKNRRFQNLFG